MSSLRALSVVNRPEARVVDLLLVHAQIQKDLHNLAVVVAVDQSPVEGVIAVVGDLQSRRGMVVKFSSVSYLHLYVVGREHRIAFFRYSTSVLDLGNAKLAINHPFFLY